MKKQTDHSAEFHFEGEDLCGAVECLELYAPKVNELIRRYWPLDEQEANYPRLLAALASRINDEKTCLVCHVHFLPVRNKKTCSEKCSEQLKITNKRLKAPIPSKPRLKLLPCDLCGSELKQIKLRKTYRECICNNSKCRKLQRRPLVI